MLAFNLLHLVNGTANTTQNVLALEKLADATNGPLRFTVTGGMPRLGVRTWGQFFKEYVLNDHLYIKQKEEETLEAVDNYAAKFLKMQLEASADAMQKTAWKQLHGIISKLQAKANGSDVRPKLLKSACIKSATTQPIFRDPKIHHAKIKTFDGKLVVPQGLSMGTAPFINVMADRRFESSRNKVTNKYGEAESMKIEQGSTEYSEDDYYEFYKEKLDTVKHSERSVAIKVIAYSNLEESDASRNGAWRAASEFVKKRKNADNPASVFLRVEKMPEVKVRRAEASKSSRKVANQAVSSEQVRRAEASGPSPKPSEALNAEQVARSTKQQKKKNPIMISDDENDE